VLLQASLRAVVCLIISFAARMTLVCNSAKSEIPNPQFRVCHAGFRRAGIDGLKRRPLQARLRESRFLNLALSRSEKACASNSEILSNPAGPVILQLIGNANPLGLPSSVFDLHSSLRCYALAGQPAFVLSQASPKLSVRVAIRLCPPKPIRSHQLWN
jgi:hypothetical protein